MTFKDFLILEFGNADAASDFFYGLQLYPTDAFDFTPSSTFPQEVYFLRNRWKNEKKQGRDFINIDYNQFQDVRFTSIESQDAPKASGGFWRHKPDNKSSLKVVTNQDMTAIGISKNSKPKKLTTSNKNYSLDVDKLFGDKGTGKVPTLSNDFDKPFKKVYENITPYDVVGQPPVNTHMGVASKYVGPDDTDTGQPTEEVPMADFGFEDRPKKRRRFLKKFQKKA
jgi:hypothetical protein